MDKQNGQNADPKPRPVDPRAFTFMTISGERYTMNLRRAWRMFFGRGNLQRLLLATILLATLVMPQNYIYHFTWFTRIAFWSLVSLGFLVIWNVFFVFGGYWSRWSGRAYLLMFGTICTCIILTFAIHQFFPLGPENDDPSASYLILEMIMLSIYFTLVQAVYYSVFVGRKYDKEQRAKARHEWEDF